MRKPSKVKYLYSLNSVTSLYLTSGVSRNFFADSSELNRTKQDP